MPDIAKRLEALLDETGRRLDEVLGAGLSVPGTADTTRGCSLDSPTMSGWDGIPLPPYLRELTAAPILLDNDANVIVLSERRGQRDRFDDMLLIKASTGLGAGIVAGGMLQRGSVGAAGEFGHTKISAAAGMVCRCGDTGCLEAIAADMAKAYDILVAGLRETVYGNATAVATRELQILPSTHGDQSGVIGSAAMILA